MRKSTFLDEVWHLCVLLLLPIWSVTHTTFTLSVIYSLNYFANVKWKFRMLFRLWFPKYLIFGWYSIVEASLSRYGRKVGLILKRCDFDFKLSRFSDKRLTITSWAGTIILCRDKMLIVKSFIHLFLFLSLRNQRNAKKISVLLWIWLQLSLIFSIWRSRIVTGVVLAMVDTLRDWSCGMFWMVIGFFLALFRHIALLYWRHTEISVSRGTLCRIVSRWKIIVHVINMSKSGSFSSIWFHHFFHVFMTVKIVFLKVVVDYKLKRISFLFGWLLSRF